MEVVQAPLRWVNLREELEKPPHPPAPPDSCPRSCSGLGLGKVRPGRCGHKGGLVRCPEGKGGLVTCRKDKGGSGWHQGHSARHRDSDAPETGRGDSDDLELGQGDSGVPGRGPGGFQYWYWPPLPLHWSGCGAACPRSWGGRRAAPHHSMSPVRGDQAARKAAWVCRSGSLQ